VLVVQAGTATSTRVREQEQSFNTVDVGEGSATITVNAWKGDSFEPSDARAYGWHDGRWSLKKAAEPAH
jgi:hypothetical protein